MWAPTHVKVTVQRARGLLCKGENGTNDVFVTIALGKEKYQTSVKDRATDPVEWHEECELPIPAEEGNKARVVLTALHRNFIGDEFLGQISIPLADIGVFEKPRNKWYQLQTKPTGKEKTITNKEHGELEVRIGFTRRSAAGAGSLSDFSKKENLGPGKATVEPIKKDKEEAKPPGPNQEPLVVVMGKPLVFSVSSVFKEDSEGKHVPMPLQIQIQQITNKDEPKRMKKETTDFSRISREDIERFDGKSREDLIQMVLSLEATGDSQKQKLRDMDD